MVFNKESARHTLLFLYPWVLLGLVLRLWRASLQVVMFRDETTYAFQIKHILNGTIFQDPTYYTFPPAYPLLAAPIALVTGDPEFAGRLVSCIMGAATAIPAYYLASDLFGRRAAAVAAAMTALAPPLMSAGVMSEPTYGFFLTLSLYLGNRAYGSGCGRDYFVFGLAMAACYLSRPEGFFVFFAYLLALFLVLLLKDRSGARGSLGLTGLALAGFLVLAFPYMLQLRSHFGAWEISGKTRINLAKVKTAEGLRHGESFDARDAQVYQELERNRRTLMGNIAQEFSAMTRRYPGNLKSELTSFADMAGYPLLAAFFAGLGFAFFRRGGVKELLLPAAAYAPFFVIPAVFVLERVLMPYLPMILIPAAYGVSRLSEEAGRRLQAVKANAPAALLTAGFGLTAFAGYLGDVVPETDVGKVLRSDPGYEYYYDLRRTAERIRPHIEPGSRIITRNNIFAYYAGGEYVPIPYSSLEDMVGYAKEHGARYLFYGEMEQGLRPQFMTVFYRSDYPVADPLGDGRLRLKYSSFEFLFYEFTGTEGG